MPELIDADWTVGSLNWSVIEVGTAIVCASISSLRPLATKYLPNIFNHLTQPSEHPHTRLECPKVEGSSGVESEISRAGKGDNSIYVSQSFEMVVMTEEERVKGRGEWMERESQEVLVREAK